VIIQGTLLTAHRGVDLHAASARRVMGRRLAGGERLLGLQRAVLHTCWRREGDPGALSLERLLAQGRFYNPNKHRFALAELDGAPTEWFTASGHELPDGWPGALRDSDLPRGEGTVLDRLLGGPPAGGETVVDLCTFPLGERGPLLSGVVWRLRLPADEPAPAVLAENLAVARDRAHGLLVNPWMQGWRLGAPLRNQE